MSNHKKHTERIKLLAELHGRIASLLLIIPPLFSDFFGKYFLTLIGIFIILYGIYPCGV